MIKIGNKFIADNGKKFLTESDCIDYEKTVLATSLQGKMFDRDLKPVDNFQNAYYFLLNEKQDLEEIEKINQEFQSITEKLNKEIDQYKAIINKPVKQDNENISPEDYQNLLIQNSYLVELIKTKEEEINQLKGKN